MLKPHESGLLQTAAENFREFSNVGRGYMTPEVISAHAKQMGMTERWIGVGQGRGYGFTEAGFDAVAKLARSLRAGRTAGLRRANGWVLEKAVASILSRKLAGRPAGRLPAEAVADVHARIIEWLDGHDVPRTHFVPCRITPSQERPFRIGAVSFLSRVTFAARELQLRAEAEPEHAVGSRAFGVDEMLESMEQSHSDWVAQVEVAGHEPRASAEAADLMVDVALGALQLVVPSGHYEGIGRTTGRIAPVLPRSLVMQDGHVTGGISNQQPGRAVSHGGFTEFVQKGDAILASAGRRISGFLEASSDNPRLDEAWCNAAYWFHLAMSETVPTVALTQIETAVEVLFRSASAKGSGSRFADALDVFFDLRDDDPIPGGTSTAKQFASFVVGSRSKVLHGTWSTLDIDIPEGYDGALVSADYIKNFGRQLLVAVSLAIDEFAATGIKNAEMSDLIRWSVDGRASANQKAE